VKVAEQTELGQLASSDSFKKTIIEAVCPSVIFVVSESILQVICVAVEVST